MRLALGTWLAMMALAASAHAADSTMDILNQPSMTLAPGARSMPVALDAPVAPVVVKKETIKVVEAPAPKAEAKTQNVPAQPVAPPAPDVTTPAGQGQSLKDILAKAYTDSPALRAEREALRQQYENIAVAQSNARPIVTADGGVAWVNADTDPGTRDSYASSDVGITGTQFLYRGGRTLAEVEQQLALSDAALAAYDTATQNVMLNVVTAAMDIQRDRATIDLTEQNRAVIARALQSAQNGFKVGELTRTDVAQAKARLAAADAQLIASRADYASAIARFLQYAGQDGAQLVVADDAKSVSVPASVDTARTTADSEHPAVRAAIEGEKASEFAVKVAQGALLPSVYAQGSAGYARNPSSIVDSTTTASVGVRALVPLYDGGANRALIRQAKYGQREKQSRIEDARRSVEEQVSSAWNDYQAAQAQIGARAEQVAAAELARNGVYKEREVGTRTVLDTLNADAELLDAQVGQVQARRDAVVAGYALLAATGQLTGEKLGYFSADAEKALQNRIRHKWFGTDVEAAQ
jgi:TolC family type I secretion outer membrane protein